MPKKLSERFKENILFTVEGGMFGCLPRFIFLESGLTRFIQVWKMGTVYNRAEYYSSNFIVAY